MFIIYIVDQINSGKLIAGSKVNENAISESLKVSRTPVKRGINTTIFRGVIRKCSKKRVCHQEPHKRRSKRNLLYHWRSRWLGSFTGNAFFNRETHERNGILYPEYGLSHQYRKFPYV